MQSIVFFISHFLKWGFLGGCLVLASCQTAPTVAWNPTGSEQTRRLELILLDSSFIKDDHLLAVTAVDGEKLPAPWIFGIDIITLSPEAHTLELSVGAWNYNSKTGFDPGQITWESEPETIQLQELDTENGVYFLVNHNEIIYLSNTKQIGYLRKWRVSYPREFNGGTPWNIEPIELEAERTSL